jgi:FKBP-type peptidyl-prolyl cis-trans isomerase
LGAGQVLWGVDLVVASMKVGEKALVTIHPPYAFDSDSGEGTKAADIKPEEILKCEIELLKFEQVRNEMG